MDKINQIATDIVVEKAVEDKMKQAMQEMQQEEHVADQEDKEEDKLSDISADSGEMEIMRQMKEKMGMLMPEYTKKKQQMALKGSYESKTEKQFFEYVENKKERIVVHFAHEKFERCKLVDMHLKKLAYDHPETLFIRLDAEKCTFLVSKLQIRVLPAIFCFMKGEVVDMLIGFEEFDNKDDFSTNMLAQRISINFAPAPLTVPETVSVRQVDLGLELQVLSYYAARDAEAG